MLGLLHAYHLLSNFLAEGAQTFKESMKKQLADSLINNTYIALFLFSYHIAPHAITGTGPAELLFGKLPIHIWTY